MPRVTIDLMQWAARENEPFYERLVATFYRECRSRHRRFPLIRARQVGVGLCHLPDTFEKYLQMIEPAARRNYKKAIRMGCAFRRIQFNEHLEEIKAIQQSTDVRQGRRMPDSYIAGTIAPCTDPPSRTAIHDYPYFGVFYHNRLSAYAACLVSGELGELEHILGHAQSLDVGIVPTLIIEIARYLIEQFPAVRYYTYGTYFGATPTMQRFKKKFCFYPHHVTWELGDTPPAGSTQCQMVTPYNRS